MIFITTTFFVTADIYVAIDPKPFLADREYDVPSFLWNPLDNLMDDHEQTERRIAAFVASGLDDFKIRAWSVIRGSYMRPQDHFVRALRAADCIKLQIREERVTKDFPGAYLGALGRFVGTTNKGVDDGGNV